MVDTITYPSGVKAEVYMPATSAPRAAIIMAHGSDGFTDEFHGPWKTMMRDYAGALSQDGFSVFIPFYFEATGTEPPLDIATFSNPDLILQILQDRVRWEQALSDAIDYTNLDPSHVGLLGFSLGGHLCLQLRRRAQVLVEFFAPDIPWLQSAGSVPFAQIHHGESDELVPIRNGESIRDKLEGEGTEWEFYPYAGATHGFRTNTPADEDAKSESRRLTLEFFKRHL